jgi:replication factor C subunit 1
LKPGALDEIIIMGANQDVRQILHHLSMLASAKKSLSTESAKLEASKSKKDLKLGPWDVVKKVFSADEHKGMSIHDRTGLFFQDYSFGPLFVQENYPCVVPQAAKGSAIKTLDLLGRTAHCISQTDLIKKVIRSQNAWSLLPVEAVFASVVPGQLMLEGFISSQIVFPSWLGKNSRTNKMDRLLQERQTHMRLKISGSKQAVNLDYLSQLSLRPQFDRRTFEVVRGRRGQRGYPGDGELRSGEGGSRLAPRGGSMAT